MISKFNRKVLICGAFAAALLSPLAQVGMARQAEQPVAKTGPEAAKYTSFRNEEYELYAWQGENVAFLIRSKDLDLRVMDKLCQTFDLVYDYYAHATGRTPRPLPRTTYRGRSTVAEVTNTCGAGCGYLGVQGIELMPGAFRGLYEGVRDRNQYDQVLFYEFGRNFWFYANKIGYKKHTAQTDAIETGYAVFMRFMAAEVSGVAGGPVNGFCRIHDLFPRFRGN